ncbi:MAG TPA: glycosyltransferase family 4 protein [Nitrospirota bacterium]|nr:glycosyltransferase family 4 protein [Nitrospirota bacterium]
MSLKSIRKKTNDWIRFLCYKAEHPKTDKERLVIYDDTFPCLLSPFRITEFNAYLGHFDNSVVYSSFGRFREEKKKYRTLYPQYASRIFKFNKFIDFSGKLAYIVFLHNTYEFLPYIEKYKVPFVFELYPGGFFRLDNKVSDSRLKRILSSPYFRKVIVTQKISYEYLIQKKLCKPDQIEFVYGVVLPIHWYMRNRKQKKYYPDDKASFDICFVANKYLPEGRDKGYDVFIEAAKILKKKNKDVKFHVVGNFDRTDMDVTAIDRDIYFYGSRHTRFFPDFYSHMDIILSPNKPFLLEQGAFDGFPTGCCIEAGICGVAIFATDILNLNCSFADGEDIVIINTLVDEIVDKITYYHDNPKRLYELAKKGTIAIQEMFDEDKQIGARLKVINGYMKLTGGVGHG